MAKPYSKLREGMSPERRARNEAEARKMLEAMPLHGLRQARRMSQQTLASNLGIAQGSVSKMERRTDMYISTLRSYIEAMGGALVIQAHLPEGVVPIEQFSSIEERPEKHITSRIVGLRNAARVTAHAHAG